MPEQSQADRKRNEARVVAWIGRAIGVSSLGMTGMLSVAASVQGQDTLLFQQSHPARVANYDTLPPPVTQVVVEVPVPSPLPPTHIPASAAAAAAAAAVGAAGGAGVNRQAVAAVPPPPQTVVRPGVAPPAAPPPPAPVATSSGSVPH
jgi:hypothetical protein